MFRSMSEVFKTFLLWMMLLALPVQGMAQASMFACHLQGKDSTEVSSTAGSTAHRIDYNSVDHNGMDHSMHSSAASEHHGEHADSYSSKKLMKSLHGCCNCAPTCAVVLVSTTTSSFAAVQHDTLRPVSSSQVPHSADTRRIDRPPKPLAI